MSLHGNQPVFEVVEESEVVTSDVEVETYDPDLEDDGDGED